MEIGKFCKACKDINSGDNISIVSICKEQVDEGTAECTKFDLDKVANDIPEIKGKDGGVKDKLTITRKMLFTKDGKIYFHGEDKETKGEDVDFEIKKDDGVWSLFDPKKDGGAGWIPFSEYLTTSLYEQTLKEQKEMKSISDQIGSKLRDIFFYTLSDTKGKERVIFTVEDKGDIERHLKDLHNQNIVGDRGFVMAVVRAKGSEKEGGQLIKVGSYPKDSNVNLGFGEEKGLGGLVGTQYFSIKNNDGPDDRDFEIVKGDIYKDIEFKKEVEVEEPKEMMSQPVKEEPYEEVMKQKELKGLASLVNSDEVGNNFTKKQREILEKLKGQGYLFKRPVEDTNYKQTKVNSSEFTESFNVWKKQN